MSRYKYLISSNLSDISKLSTASQWLKTVHEITETGSPVKSNPEVAK